MTALLFGGVVIILTDFENLSRLGTDPIGASLALVAGVFKGYGSMLAGAFGDPTRILTAIQSGATKDIATAIRPITETLVAATPLIFTGLAVADLVPGRHVQHRWRRAADHRRPGRDDHRDRPARAAPLAGDPAGIAGGGGPRGRAWGFIPGFLKARTGAHEVITTIMLNYIAAQVVFFALRSDALRAAGSTTPISRNLRPIAEVPTIIDLPGIRLDYGFIVALLMAVVVSSLLFRTTKGFELRAAGFNLTAARYAGMSAGGSMMLAMALSGALCGMAGGFLVIGTVGQLSLDLSGGIGFNAIALALLAGLRPSGVVLAALLFGALTTGGKQMGIETGIPFDLLVFIMALVIMFVAAPGLIRSIWRIKVAKPAPELAVSTQPTASE